MTAEFQSELRLFIEANRDRALWWMPPDYFPADEAGARRILEKIAARGDRQTWIRARQMLRELKQTKTASRTIEKPFSRG